MAHLSPKDENHKCTYLPTNINLTRIELLFRFENASKGIFCLNLYNVCPYFVYPSKATQTLKDGGRLPIHPCRKERTWVIVYRSVEEHCLVVLREDMYLLFNAGSILRQSIFYSVSVCLSTHVLSKEIKASYHIKEYKFRHLSLLGYTLMPRAVFARKATIKWYELLCLFVPVTQQNKARTAQISYLEMMYPKYEFRTKRFHLDNAVF